MSLSDLEIVVLSHNRPKMLRKMANSLLQFKDNGAYVWISDNSSSTTVADFFQDGNIPVPLKRNSTKTAGEHYVAVCSELSRPYCMVVHDDDYFLGSAHHIVRVHLSWLHTYGAIGFNAFVAYDSIVSRDLFYNSLAFISPIRSHIDVVRMYYPYSKSITPFPAYIYRADVFKDAMAVCGSLLPSRMNDVLIVSLIASSQGILRIDIPVMAYNIHSGNDTSKISVADFSALRLNMSRITNSKNSLPVHYIRSQYICSRLSLRRYPQSSLAISSYLLNFFRSYPFDCLKLYGAYFMVRIALLHMLASVNLYANRI
jgi:hypothetical protein